MTSEDTAASSPSTSPSPPAPATPAHPAPAIHVASSPHLKAPRQTTRWMMLDVLIALIPVMLAAFYFFRWYAVLQVGICVLSCLAAEWAFMRMRGQNRTVCDGSATVTGVILGLSLPWSAPWYVGVIASGVAIGLGKVVFGGLGFNVFNPAMVGRAFVMLSFARELGSSAYVNTASSLQVLTQATPLTAAKTGAETMPGLWPMFLGNQNGSLGEVSILACLIGGIYLCARRSASWEIPVGCLLSTLVLGGLANLAGLTDLTALHHLAGGALVFGAFFIATDPVTSPIVPLGKFLFGVGIGFFVILIRCFSGYPEGLMFAILLMNATVPLLNRWTLPRPLGGPIPKKA